MSPSNVFFAVVYTPVAGVSKLTLLQKLCPLQSHAPQRRSGPHTPPTGPPRGATTHKRARVQSSKFGPWSTVGARVKYVSEDGYEPELGYIAEYRDDKYYIVFDVGGLDEDWYECTDVCLTVLGV